MRLFAVICANIGFTILWFGMIVTVMILLLPANDPQPPSWSIWVIFPFAVVTPTAYIAFNRAIG